MYASVANPMFLYSLPITMFLNRRAAARYGALASIVPGRERFSWNFSFQFSKDFSLINIL
jgi:hypothetical protein